MEVAWEMMRTDGGDVGYKQDYGKRSVHVRAKHSFKYFKGQF